MVNKCLAKRLGHLEVILLAEFIYREKQAVDGGYLDNEGYFSYAQDDIENRTALSPKVQKRLCDNLVENEVLKIKYQSIPRKKWYQIGHDKIDDLLGIPEKQGAANQDQRNGDTDYQGGSQDTTPKTPENQATNNNRPLVDSTLPQSENPSSKINKEEKEKKEESDQISQKSKEENPPPPKTSQESDEKQTPPSNTPPGEMADVSPELDIAIEQKIIEDKIQNVKTYFQNRVNDRWFSHDQAISQMREILGPLYKELEQLKRPAC